MSLTSNSGHADVAIVGAGIIGLAHALAVARRGRSVMIFERSAKARGASVRNFGTIWPIGQPAGDMHQLALGSRRLWLELLESGGFPSRQTGSLHAVYRDDEVDVAREFAERGPALGYDCHWLAASAALERSSAVSPRGLCGALWSGTELSVDAERVLSWLPRYLSDRHGVQFHFGSSVTRIDLPVIRAGGSKFHADAAIVCSGDDFETLYPESFRSAGITRCKLQMMRTAPQASDWQLGPSLAGGLTFQHYASFGVCTSLGRLKRRIAEETPEVNRWGIHVLLSQTEAGEITIGDSHEYGDQVDVFDKPEVDTIILRCAERFARIPDWRIARRWHGVYAKHADKPFVSFSPAEGVKVVTALGGAGMTLSLGLAEQTVTEIGL